MTPTPKVVPYDPTVHRQVVYVLWAGPKSAGPALDTAPTDGTPAPTPLPVTDLAGYAADRARRAAAIARHPSMAGDTDTDDVDG